MVTCITRAYAMHHSEWHAVAYLCVASDVARISNIV